MIKIDWSNAPKDATHYLPETDEFFACWIKPGHSMRVGLQDGWKDDEDDRAKHLYIERPTEWNGEGLPPVDLPVEWYSDSNTGWQEIVVLAYHGDDAWIQPKGKESTIVYNIANFRPIRTPEQIAAEKEAQRKQETVVAALRAIGGSQSKITSASNVYDVISALYDAGLIKAE